MFFILIFMLVHEVKRTIVEDFVQYIEMLKLDEDRLDLFIITNVSMDGGKCEFILTIDSPVPKLSSKWLISCEDCLKLHIDSTTSPAHDIAIKYGILVIGTSYVTGAYFKAVRLNV